MTSQRVTLENFGRPLGHGCRRILGALLLIQLVTGVGASDANAASSVSHAETDRLVAAFKAAPAERRAGAVVVFKEDRISSRGGGYTVNVTRILLAILDEKAVQDYSRIAISFNSFYSELSVDFAHVIDVNGIRHPVRSDAIQTKTPESELSFSDIQEVAFSLPALAAGTFVEFQTTEHTRKLVIDGHWYKTVAFNWGQVTALNKVPRLDPVRDSRIIVDFPSDEPLRTETRSLDAAPSRSVADGRVVLSWEARNLAGIPFEFAMPELSETLPRVVFSTFRDWKMIDTWGKDIYLPSPQSTPAVAKLVSDLTKGKPSKRERIESVFRYLRGNVRYIAADFKRGGITPHSIDEILKNKYGDCKDQAVLFATALRALGIEAYPALISPHPQLGADLKLPNLRFSHMIVYVPDAQGDIWLDTSDSVSEFPGIHWTLEGRTAFVINGKGGLLGTVPRSSSSRNTVVVQIDFRHEQDDLIAEIRVTTSGAISDQFMAFAKYNAHAKEEISKIVRSIYGAGDLRSIQYSETSGIRGPFEFSGVIHFRDQGKKQPGPSHFSGHVGTLINRFSPFTSLQPPSERQHHYSAGFAQLLKMETRIPRPSPEHRDVFLRTGQSMDSPMFVVHHSRRHEDDAVVVTDIFELRQAMIARKDYDLFFSDLKSVVSSAPWLLEYKPDKLYSEQRRLEKDVRASDRKRSALIALARHFVKVGEYDKAKPLLEEALRTDQKDGEAHYLLGITYGFMDDHQASKREFNRARELGYRP